MGALLNSDKDWYSSFVALPSRLILSAIARPAFVQDQRPDDADNTIHLKEK